MNRRQLFKRAGILVAGVAAAPLVGVEPAPQLEAADLAEVAEAANAAAESLLDLAATADRLTPSSWVEPAGYGFGNDPNTGYYRAPDGRVHDVVDGRVADDLGLYVARGILEEWRRDAMCGDLKRTMITVVYGGQTWHLEKWSDADAIPVDVVPGSFVEVHFDDCGRFRSIIPAVETEADRARRTLAGLRVSHRGGTVTTTYDGPGYRFDA